MRSYLRHRAVALLVFGAPGVVPLRGPAYATIHNYQPLVPDGERADWILTTPDVTALAALVNTYRLDGQYPSDHLPVEVRLRLP